MHIIDTSAIIGMVERVGQTPSLRQMLHEAADDDDIATTEITLGELQHGVFAATIPSVAQRRQRTHQAISQLRVYSIADSPTTTERYAALRVLQPRCGQNDTWILAICAAAGGTLVTEDERLAELATAATTPSLLLSSREKPTI